MKNKGKRKYIAQYVDGNIGIFAILRLTEQSLLDRKWFDIISTYMTITAFVFVFHFCDDDDCHSKVYLMYLDTPFHCFLKLFSMV